MFRMLLLLPFLIFLSTPAAAQGDVDLKQWSQLPVLHGGRVQPIDSFARIHLKKFSGKEVVHRKTASEWLAAVLFAPDEAALMPVFKIRNFEAYNLPKNKLYSYVEIAPILHRQRDVIRTLLDKGEKEWTPEQQELIELYNNVSLYVQLLRALTGVLPLNIQSKDSKSYLDLKDAQNTAAIAQPLAIIKEGGENNIYLRLVPTDWQNLQGEWQSLWEAIKREEIKAETLSYLKNWQSLAHAYREGDTVQWNKALNVVPPALVTKKLGVEHLYNSLKLLTVATILYVLGFALVVAGNLLRNKRLAALSFLSLAVGAVANALDIGLRVYILERAPVGTLYESVIFVGLICVLGFLILERKYKNQTGLLLGSISGALLLIVAESFAGEDTMSTLVAVLNTNFWLLTHVICITIGYAICFLTAMVAHYYLTLKVWKPTGKEALKQLVSAAKTLSIIALLFTTIGTILGGIWADQSWGRFWGWDPKENGALLIVLWLVWLLHGRISKHINEVGFMIGSALLSVIVVLAWFGVNLLSVGLHSYGFVSGVAFGIALFCIAEFVLVGGLWFWGRAKGQTP